MSASNKETAMIEVEFCKSGPNRWTARNNNWTIANVSGYYFLRDGHGNLIDEYGSLRAAKAAATEKENAR